MKRTQISSLTWNFIFFTNKVISALYINGEIVKDHTLIAEKQQFFYETLYSEKINQNNPRYTENLNKCLQNNDQTRLSQKQKELCDRPVSQYKILRSIKELSNGRTPGTDGLPADWYKYFWIDVKSTLTDSIIYALKSRTLSIEQKRGIITLLPKKNKNRLELKHWRPISLPNTDYKIIAKLLATRLKEVLPSVIDEDQSGYMKGRYIGQNIRILEDISFFTKQKKLHGILLSIDFEKAFDSLNWNSLYKTLENFGNIFIGYIKTMYNDIELTILNNGTTCKFFKLQRRVRQGCPLSAFLFIISLETLANNIRNDKSIKGIKIDRK